MYMVVPCVVQILNNEGLGFENICQPLIIEDGMEYSLVKHPHSSFEVWFGKDVYIFDSNDFVFIHKFSNEYMIVPFDKILVQ